MFNFNYRDGARMLTMGGLLYDRGQAGIVNGAFDGLSFIRPDEEPYLIEIPYLTYREMRYLDTHLPDSSYADLDSQGIPESDSTKYSQTTGTFLCMPRPKCGIFFERVGFKRKSIFQQTPPLTKCDGLESTSPTTNQ